MRGENHVSVPPLQLNAFFVLFIASDVADGFQQAQRQSFSRSRGREEYGDQLARSGMPGGSFTWILSANELKRDQCSGECNDFAAK